MSHQETDPRVSGPKLHAAMAALFPELAQTRVSHSWCGFVAYTFDELMHLGKHDGMYTTACTTRWGIAAPAWARPVTSACASASSCSDARKAAPHWTGLAFQTGPPYRGNPWFLAPSIAYYRWRDSLAG